MLGGQEERKERKDTELKNLLEIPSISSLVWTLANQDVLGRVWHSVFLKLFS